MQWPGEPKNKTGNFVSLDDVRCDLCNPTAGRPMARSPAITPDMERLGMNKESGGMANSMQFPGIVVSCQLQSVFGI